MSKKIQVSFSDKQAELLSKLRGEFGDSESEVVRGIVLAWLAEKSFISAAVKNRIREVVPLDNVADKENEK